MEATAVILPGGRVIKKTSTRSGKNYSLLDQWYTPNGYLTRFNIVRNNVEVRFDLFNNIINNAAFYNYEQYLDFRNDPVKYPFDKIEKIGLDYFEDAQIKTDTSSGEIVFAWERIVDATNKIYYFRKINFEYTPEYDFSNTISIPAQNNLLPEVEENKKYEENPSAVAFFYNNFDLCPDKNVLLNIAALISNIDREIFTAFDESDYPPGQQYNDLLIIQRLKWAGNDIINDLEKDNFVFASNPFPEIPNFDILKAYKKYLNDLNGFYITILEQLRELEKSTDKDRIAAILASFSPSVISSMSFSDRKEYLKTILRIPITNLVLDLPIFRYPSTVFPVPLFIDPSLKFTSSYFKAILNIVASFTIDYEENLNNRNDFLAFLLEVSYTGESFNGDKQHITYFQNIYNLLIDNVALDKFVGNILNDNTLLAQYKRQYITYLYSIWIHSSSFNPYYTSDYETNFPNSDFKDHTDYIYDEKTPASLNYEAHKMIWFFDNYNFKFNEWKIEAYEERLNEPGTSVTPFRYDLVGNYDIFQPVYLMQESYDNETFIPIPKITNLPAYNAEDGDDNPSNYFIPIFYLKYVDDTGDIQDFLISAELAFDVAATFLGAGLVTKLRYLKHISFLRKLVPIGAAEVEFIVASAEVVSIQIGLGVDAVIAITAGVCRLVIKYLFDGCTIYRGVVLDGDGEPLPPDPSSYPTPEEYQDALDDYNDYKICKEIDNWLFAIELLSIGGQIAGLYKLQKASQRFYTAYQNLSPARKAQFEGYSMNYNYEGQITVITGTEIITQVRRFALMESQVAEFKTFLTANNLTAIYNRLIVMDEMEAAAFTATFFKKAQNPDDLIKALKIVNNNPQSISSWEYFFTRNFEEANYLDIITNNALVDRYRTFINEPALKLELMRLTIEQRKYLALNTGSLNSVRLNFVKNNSKYVGLLALSRAEMIVDTIDSQKKVRSNFSLFTINETYNIIDAGLPNQYADYLVHLSKITFETSAENFTKVIDVQPISDVVLKNLYELYSGASGPITNFNRLFVNIKMYNGSTLLNTVDEVYISGDSKSLSKAFNNNLPSVFIEQTATQDKLKFSTFNRNAFSPSLTSKKYRTRHDDTEVKFVYNFLNVHLNNGATKYVIEMNSLLYTCQSCQRYLEALYAYGKTNGLEIIIISRANKKALTMAELDDIIEQIP